MLAQKTPWKDSALFLSSIFFFSLLVVGCSETKKTASKPTWKPPLPNQKLPENFPSAIPATITFQWSDKFEKELWPRKYQGLILFSPEDRVIYFDLVDMGVINPEK